MSEYDDMISEMDFSGDNDGYVPDSHLGKRFPVTNIVVHEIELGEAA